MTDMRSRCPDDEPPKEMKCIVDRGIWVRDIWWCSAWTPKGHERKARLLACFADYKFPVRFYWRVHAQPETRTSILKPVFSEFALAKPTVQTH